MSTGSHLGSHEMDLNELERFLLFARNSGHWSFVERKRKKWYSSRREAFFLKRFRYKDFFLDKRGTSRRTSREPCFSRAAWHAVGRKATAKKRRTFCLFFFFLFSFSLPLYAHIFDGKSLMRNSMTAIACAAVNGDAMCFRHIGALH